MTKVQNDGQRAFVFHPFHIPRQRPFRWLRSLVPIIVAIIAVHVLLPQLANLEQTLGVLRSISTWLLALAAFMQAGSYIGSGILLQGLVRLERGQLRLTRAIMVAMASASIGLVTGGFVGASAAAYNWIRATGVSAEGAALAASLKSIFNNGLLFLLSIIGLIHLTITHALSTAQAVGFLSTLLFFVAILGTLVWSAVHPEPLTTALNKVNNRWAEWRGKTADPTAVERIVCQLHNTWIVLRSDGWHLPLLGSALNIAFDIATLYILFAAAGQAITIEVLLTGYGLSLLAGKIVPGGVGVVEASMSGIYTSLGIASTIAVVVTLIYRLLSFTAPTLIGFLLAAYLQRIEHRGPEHAAAA